MTPTSRVKPRASETVTTVAPGALPVTVTVWAFWSTETSASEGSRIVAPIGASAEPTVMRCDVPIGTWSAAGATTIGGAVGVGVGPAEGLGSVSGTAPGVAGGALGKGVADGGGVGNGE